MLFRLFVRIWRQESEGRGERGRGLLPSDVLRGRTAVLRACQEYVKRLVDMARLMLDIIDCFKRWDKDGAEQLFVRMRELDDLLHEDRIKIIENLSESPALLPSRDDVMRFLYQISEIADFYEGAVFRMIQLMRERKIPDSVRESISELADAVSKIVEKLHEVTMALTMNPSAARRLISEVESLEKQVDRLYREAEMKILDGNLKIKAIFLARDVASFLEDAADKALDAADTVRILMMGL